MVSSAAMSFRRVVIGWMAVSFGRTIQVTIPFWLLLALLVHWEFLEDWRDFVLPLCWFTGVTFAIIFAIRRHELAGTFE